MKLYRVTYINDFFDETLKEFLSESDDLNQLRDLGNQEAKDPGFQDQVWSSLVPPTMGDRKFSKAIIEQLKLSEKVFLIIK